MQQLKVGMLNITKVEVDIISDVDMYLFFEKGMRGVVPYISKRYTNPTKSI